MIKNSLTRHDFHIGSCWFAMLGKGKERSTRRRLCTLSGRPSTAAGYHFLAYYMKHPCTWYEVQPSVNKNRLISTAASSDDKLNTHNHSHSHHVIPPWPISQTPSPYEIFGILPSQFNKSKIRILFYQMAKVYHPDSNGGGDKLGNAMSNEIRAERFKKLVEAYDILKSDNKRLAYNSRASAEARSKHYHQRHPTHGPSPTTRSSPFMSDNFYSRGFHEGYEEEASRRASDAQFQEQLKENRFKLAALLGVAISLVAILQLTAIFKFAEKSQEKIEHATWLAEMENIKARSNYDMGSTSDDRVSRFLAIRNSSGYYDNYQKPLPDSAESSRT